MPASPPASEISFDLPPEAGLGDDLGSEKVLEMAWAWLDSCAGGGMAARRMRK